MTRIAVFSGLTLQAAEVQEILPEADACPPIERGDVERAIARGTAVLVVIDGKFQQSLAVSCVELMDALRSGLAVYGASSMGAMRASELEAYGMVGHGRIFEHIRSAEIFRDDLLGQAFSEDLGKAFSLPYLDVYFNLASLLRRRKITREEFEAACEIARDAHFVDRSPAMLAAAAAQRSERLGQAMDQACRRMGSQKKRDALGLLRRVRDDLSRVARRNEALDPIGRERVTSHEAYRFGYPHELTEERAGGR